MKPQIILGIGPIAATEGAIVVDHRNRCFWRAGQRRPEENRYANRVNVRFSLLSALILRSPGIVTWRELIEHCYGDRACGGPDAAGQTLNVILYQQRALCEWLGGSAINHAHFGTRFEFHPAALRSVA